MLNESGCIIRMQPGDSDAKSARFSPASEPDNNAASHEPGGHHLPVRAIDEQQRTTQQQRRANAKEVA